MATSTFSGPLRIGNSDTVVGVVPAARTLSLVPTANINTDLTLAMPAQYGTLRITFYTTTAYTGATVNVQVGTTSGGSEVVGATNIKSAGVVSGTIAIANPTSMTATTLFVRIVQTATVTAVGAGQMVIEYLPISG
jgi:hypothetical protein